MTVQKCIDSFAEKEQHWYFLLKSLLKIGVFAIGPLGPWPPFELQKNPHRPMAKNATSEKFPNSLKY